MIANANSLVVALPFVGCWLLWNWKRAHQQVLFSVGDAALGSGEEFDQRVEEGRFLIRNGRRALAMSRGDGEAPSGSTYGNRFGPVPTGGIQCPLHRHIWSQHTTFVVLPPVVEQAHWPRIPWILVITRV